MSTIAEDIAECFDDRGCTGLTIWLNSDQHVQVSMCGPDKKSWGCHTKPDLYEAMREAVDAYLKFYKPTKPRVPADLKKRRRDSEDLI